MTDRCPTCGETPPTGCAGPPGCIEFDRFPWGEPELRPSVRFVVRAVRWFLRKANP